MALAEMKPATAGSPADRSAAGKAQRAETPRRAHGEWSAPPDRADPVEILEEQARTRVPELVPIRYGRMLTSPFAFYRGAAAIMAADLAAEPRMGLDVQLCGDAHLANFGIFAAPDRRLVFSLNDFDETLPGPFEWDVKRLAASFAVATRERRLGRVTRRHVIASAVRSYREAMHGFARMPVLSVWHERLEVDPIVAQLERDAGRRHAQRLARGVAKARTKDSLRALGRLTEVAGGERRFISRPPTIVPIEELLEPGEHERLEGAIAELLSAYGESLSDDRRRLLERFRYVHAARKVVGVGSVGTRAWIMLLVGRDDDDPLMLQIKEAQPSVLEAHLAPSAYEQCGRRVVEGQRLMQAASDILLGWHRTTGIDGAERDFYIRVLWDGKGSADMAVMDPGVMPRYAELCGWTLARAHARSGDPAAIAGYLGTGDVFDRALVAFSEAYADQNERDFAALQAAGADGRVTVQAGV